MWRWLLAWFRMKPIEQLDGPIIHHRYWSAGELIHPSWCPCGSGDDEDDCC